MQRLVYTKDCLTIQPKLVWQYSPNVGKHVICWDVCNIYQFQVLAKRLFSSPRRPDRLLDHSPLHAIGTRVSSGGKAVGVWNWALTSTEVNNWSCRFQLKCDGTRWRPEEEMKGKLANGVCSQYPSHYLGTWCIQRYYRWCASLGCQ